MPTYAFQAIGGFNMTFPLAADEDREFCDRWLHHGLPMSYAIDVRLYHAHHLTLKTFWLQHFNYGRGAFHFHQIRSQRQSEPIKVEPILLETATLSVVSKAKLVYSFPVRTISPIASSERSRLSLGKASPKVSPAVNWRNDFQSGCSEKGLEESRKDISIIEVTLLQMGIIRRICVTFMLFIDLNRLLFCADLTKNFNLEKIYQ